ncbi:unnamed protein product [marine sediment metagenome]|uniref:Uncharacterized protein n=1 Tax=marine sediment metagenome TaxID=412755 RepID=X1FHS6_9ZZZZ
MGCGADYSQAGEQSSSYGDYSSSSASDRALGLQYASNREAFVAYGRSSSSTREAVSADTLADQTAGYK